MFTFFEWHTQPPSGCRGGRWYCFRTICLLFLNDIHNGMFCQVHRCKIVLGLYVYFFWMTYTTALFYHLGVQGIVLGLYVYFFWMTYTTKMDIDDLVTDCFRTICLLFLNDIHNQVAEVTPPLLIVLGLYVYFFWMTYTTETLLCVLAI